MWVKLDFELSMSTPHVGETRQNVKDQVARHKYSIRDKLVQLPVARHFSQYGHTVSHKYLGIDGIPMRHGDEELPLRNREVQWIHCLDSL